MCREWRSFGRGGLEWGSGGRLRRDAGERGRFAGGEDLVSEGASLKVYACCH